MAPAASRCPRRRTSSGNAGPAAVAPEAADPEAAPLWPAALDDMRGMRRFGPLPVELDGAEGVAPPRRAPTRRASCSSERRAPFAAASAAATCSPTRTTGGSG